MTQSNLIDVYRLFYLESKTYTWQSQGHNVAERIDMILVSNSFKLRASDIQTTPTIYSDVLRYRAYYRLNMNTSDEVECGNSMSIISKTQHTHSK